MSVHAPGAHAAVVGAGLNMDVMGSREPVEPVCSREIIASGVHPHIIADGDAVRAVLCVVRADCAASRATIVFI